MMIERRWTMRAPIDLDVEMFFQGEESAVCKALDIGLGGVFMKINRSEVLPDEDVELVFLLGAGSHSIKHKIKAKIVRMSAQGLGLMFKDFDATAFRSLQEILRYKDSRVM